MHIIYDAKTKMAKYQTFEHRQNSYLLVCFKFFVMYKRPSGERLDKLFDLTRFNRYYKRVTHKRTRILILCDFNSLFITLYENGILIN